jgi:hypothetical protein
VAVSFIGGGNWSIGFIYFFQFILNMYHVIHQITSYIFTNLYQTLAFNILIVSQSYMVDRHDIAEKLLNTINLSLHILCLLFLSVTREVVRYGS